MSSFTAPSTYTSGAELAASALIVTPDVSNLNLRVYEESGFYPVWYRSYADEQVVTSFVHLGVPSS